MRCCGMTERVKAAELGRDPQVQARDQFSACCCTMEEKATKTGNLPHNISYVRSHKRSTFENHLSGGWANWIANAWESDLARQSKRQVGGRLAIRECRSQSSEISYLRDIILNTPSSILKMWSNLKKHRRCSKEPVLACGTTKDIFQLGSSSHQLTSRSHAKPSTNHVSLKWGR